LGIYLKDKLIQQFYGSAAILLIVMNPQFCLPAKGSAQRMAASMQSQIVFSPHFKRNRYTVRMLVLGGSNAANRAKIL